MTLRETIHIRYSSWNSKVYVILSLRWSACIHSLLHLVYTVSSILIPAGHTCFHLCSFGTHSGTVGCSTVAPSLVAVLDVAPWLMALMSPWGNWGWLLTTMTTLPSTPQHPYHIALNISNKYPKFPTPHIFTARIRTLEHKIIQIIKLTRAHRSRGKSIWRFNVAVVCSHTEGTKGCGKI